MIFPASNLSVVTLPAGDASFGLATLIINDLIPIKEPSRAHKNCNVKK